MEQKKARKRQKDRNYKNNEPYFYNYVYIVIANTFYLVVCLIYIIKTC